MEFSERLSVIRKESNNNLFQNLNYQTERISKKNLILDTAYCYSNNLPIDVPNDSGIDTDKKNTNYYKTWGKNVTYFNTSLQSTLIIDKKSEVFIESIKLYNITPDVNPILLNITTFESESYSNNPQINNKYVLTLDELVEIKTGELTDIYNKITNMDSNISNMDSNITNMDNNISNMDSNITNIIKNENSEDQTLVDENSEDQILVDENSEDQILVDENSNLDESSNTPPTRYNAVFKAKKMNYYTTMNPKNINKIEFTIENGNQETPIDNKGVFATPTTGGFGGRAIIELLIVSVD